MRRLPVVRGGVAAAIAFRMAGRHMQGSHTNGRGACMVENIMPKDTWAALLADSQARLVDVRTQGEWDQVGVPDLAEAGTAPVLVSWQHATGAVNPAFLAELRHAGVAPGQTLYFICRSGVRSMAAAHAAEAAGLGACFNVAYGFEGPQGTGTGWKADGLPWTA